MKEVDELSPRSFDDLARWSARNGQLRNGVNQSHVIGLLGRDLTVATIARREFRDDDSHDKQADRLLDVRPMRDGKLLLRAGEKEIEPERGRQGCDESRSPAAHDSDGDDDGNENQRSRRAGKVRPERHHDGGHGEWQCEPRQYEQQASMTLEHVHNDLALTEQF